LGYTLPAPINTIHAQCGDTHADNTTHNAVPREVFRASYEDKKGVMTNVVETGNPIFVATVSQVDEPIKAHIMPSMSIAGCCSKADTLRILLRMVSATRDPTRTAPANSITVAISIACFIVKDREETDVAKELATSFAPMFQASRKAKSMPIAKM
jgi:hypothetical protein